jgi:hypothetical protein
MIVVGRAPFTDEILLRFVVTQARCALGGAPGRPAQVARDPGAHRPLYGQRRPYDQRIVTLSVSTATHSGHMLPRVQLGRTVTISLAVPARCAV